MAVVAVAMSFYALALLHIEVKKNGRRQMTPTRNDRQMSEVGETLNLIATRRDGKRTMHYCLMFFIVGWLTFGIARHLPVTVTAATYWLWSVLGTLIIVGPLVYTYKILHAMNDLSADYNMRGI